MRNVTFRSVLLVVIVHVLCPGHCLGATGWAQPNYSLTITAHIAGSNVSQWDSTVMTLNHDGAATIQASVTTSGNEVLTSASSDTLATSYKLTGAALGATADSDWVASLTFISPAKSYSVEGVGPSDITLWLRGTSSSGRANDAGDYTASVVLTVTW
jgi:hypothetical protein